MAFTRVARNLRDSELVIEDGTTPTPLACAVTLEEGDVSWTETNEPILIYDRGVLDHARPGTEVPCEVSFSAMWTQFIQFTVDSSDPIVPYEILNNLENAFTSTIEGIYANRFEFTVTDPEGVASELITFSSVVKTSLECTEGDEFNTLSFSGQHLDERPTITRV